MRPEAAAAASAAAKVVLEEEEEEPEEVQGQEAVAVAPEAGVGAAEADWKDKSVKNNLHVCMFACLHVCMKI